jgi:hypothetical protein
MKIRNRLAPRRLELPQIKQVRGVGSQNRQGAKNAKINSAL